MGRRPLLHGIVGLYHGVSRVHASLISVKE